MSVVVETTLGDITVDLFVDQRPYECQNFLKLCTLKYYDQNLFHTVSKGYFAATGDPTGTRNGGESIFGVLHGSSKRFYKPQREPRIRHNAKGLISFIVTTSKFIGSQFLFTLGADLSHLDNQHIVFGEVVEGMHVLDLLNETECDHENRPRVEVKITHTVVLYDPFPAIHEAFSTRPRSPSPIAERLLDEHTTENEQPNLLTLRDLPRNIVMGDDLWRFPAAHLC